MALLLDLPNETLEDIIEILHYSAEEQSTSQVYVLARVSRRLSALARPIIFREVRLQKHIPGQLEHFLRSLSENPSSASMVRFATVAWGDFYNDETNQQFTELLSKLPSLRGLTFKTSLRLASTAYPIIFKIKSLSNLTSLTLIRKWATPAELNEYLSIPSLSRLDLSQTTLVRYFMVLHTPSKTPCNITTLVLAHIDSGAAESLLRCIPRLQNLEFRLSGSNFAYTRRDDRFHFSIREIAEALEPVLVSLRTLDLHICECCVPPTFGTHDRSLLDLSKAMQLRKVKVLGYCFYSMEMGKILPVTFDFSSLLPVSVEELEINFEPDRSIVTFPRTQTNVSDSSSEEDPKEDCAGLSWLLELLKMSNTSLPRLRALRLLETFVEWHASRMRKGTSLWGPPISVENAARKAGIGLEIWVHRKRWEISSYEGQPAEVAI